VQTCIVHLIRNSLAFVSWKDRKAILPVLKQQFSFWHLMDFVGVPRLGEFG